MRKLIAITALLATATITDSFGQAFNSVHAFAYIANNLPQTNADGYTPQAGLTLLGNALYGTASLGGTNGDGTIFSTDATGNNFTVLHTFNHRTGDGSLAAGGLTVSSNTLYGMTVNGGANQTGVIYSIQADGSNYQVLHNFGHNSVTLQYGTNADGGQPYGYLTVCGDTLYGPALNNGPYGSGTIFSMQTNGSNFTVLHAFATNSAANIDGCNPGSVIAVSGSMIYGTTSGGGVNSNGTIYCMQTNGSNFTLLHTFAASHNGTNADGIGHYGFGGLILASGKLYGTASAGGYYGGGVVFVVDTNGSNFAVLRHFAGDGSGPFSCPLLVGSTFYGTTSAGGAYGNGVVYSIITDGTGYTVLHDLVAKQNAAFPSYPTNSDGYNPSCALVLVGNKFFGTAQNGGTNGTGTIFSIDFPTVLKITAATQNGDGSKTLTANGCLPLTTNIVQAANDFISPVSWVPISTNVSAADGSIQFIDSSVANVAGRYYRTVLQ